MTTSIIISIDQNSDDENKRKKTLEIIMERIKSGYVSGQDCINGCCYEFNVDQEGDNGKYI